jgi:hypothetical protein
MRFAVAIAWKADARIAILVPMNIPVRIALRTVPGTVPEVVPKATAHATNLASNILPVNDLSHPTSAQLRQEAPTCGVRRV